MECLVLVINRIRFFS